MFVFMLSTEDVFFLSFFFFFVFAKWRLLKKNDFIYPYGIFKFCLYLFHLFSNTSRPICNIYMSSTVFNKIILVLFLKDCIIVLLFNDYFLTEMIYITFTSLNHAFI